MYVLTFNVPQLSSHLHPDNISPPSRCRYSCLTSIQVVSHLQPDKYGPPAACRSHLTPSKWRYKYHLHPHPIPPQPRPIDSHLNSVQVACHLNLCPDNCISPPSKWRINSFLSFQIASELHSNTITNPYRSKYIRRKSHPNWILAPSPVSHITSIQVIRFASRCNPCHAPPPNRSSYLCLQVPSETHQSIKMYVHPHTGPSWPISWSQDSSITSIHVQHHLHTYPKILV